jgi:hypothetical protein
VKLEFQDTVAPKQNTRMVAVARNMRIQLLVLLLPVFGESVIYHKLFSKKFQDMVRKFLNVFHSEF